MSERTGDGMTRQERGKLRKLVTERKGKGWRWVTCNEVMKVKVLAPGGWKRGSGLSGELWLLGKRRGVQYWVPATKGEMSWA